MSPVRGLQTYEISTRLSDRPERGGDVRPDVEDVENRLRNSGCRHLLILVHGFNNTTSAARDSYRLKLASLKEHFARSHYAPDAIALFHWPGNVGPPGWSIAGYPFDITQAKKSAERLAQYLANFPRAADPGAFKITFIGHSLGCRLILETLKLLPAPPVPNVEVVTLMAPAVPIELVDDRGALAGTVLRPRRILKCYSHKDWALWIGFPQGQHAAYALYIEDALYDEAVGLYGRPAAMGAPIRTDNGHSDYWGDLDVANQYSAAIDPTFHVLPAPLSTQGRELAAPLSTLEWTLATR